MCIRDRFCYWQFSSLSVAKNVFHTTDLQSKEYGLAVGFTGLLNGIYNVVTFVFALFLMRILAKNLPKNVHAICLVLAAIGLVTFSFVESKSLLIICVIGLGIAWASIMGVPYLMVVKDIPPKQYGVYMGIINMMIVIPMIIQTVTFGPIYKSLLNQNPNNAIFFAGTLLFIAAIGSFFLFRKPKTVANQ